MSFSLKHIPCPAGKTCTAFQCIFGHGEDDGPKADEVAPKLSSQNGSPVTRVRSPHSQETPRKRIKTEQTGNPTSSQKPSTANTSSSNANKEGNLGAVPRSATRPVSPPPIQRNVNTTNTKVKASSSASQLSSVVKGSQSPATLSSKPVKKSGTELTQKSKPESLNPRLLKSSPASHETRLKLLKMIHQEFTRLNAGLKKSGKPDELPLIISEQDLIFKALDKEQATALEKPAVYTNVMKNLVMQYKRMNVVQWKEERIKEAPQPNEEQNGGSKPKEIVTGLTSAQEVKLLSRLVTKIDDLTLHGYVSSVPTEETIATAHKGLEAAKGWEKCDRCQQRFQVFPGRRAEDGALTSGGACNFHWGKTYVPQKAVADTARVAKRYRCCGQEVGDSAGCFTHDKHVFKVGDAKRLATVLNFATTPDNANISDDRAVAFDCEMGYTVHGMELIRLTATAWPSGGELLDVLVQPIGEILDLNSRYSGVWPDDLAQAQPWAPNGPTPVKSGKDTNGKEGEKKSLKKVSSPEVARDLLFSLISPSTPLIGHGLENDLNSVRIVHPILIDTILLYPHKMGLPYRNSLKMLMDVHLNKKIQQETGSKVSGHDSAEDARAAGELVRLKIMNEWKDMQRAGWTLVDGEFWPPGKPGGALTEAFIEREN